MCIENFQYRLFLVVVCPQPLISQHHLFTYQRAYAKTQEVVLGTWRHDISGELKAFNLVVSIVILSLSQVQKTLFRVHSYALTSNTDFFDNLFTLPQPPAPEPVSKELPPFTQGGGYVLTPPATQAPAIQAPPTQQVQTEKRFKPHYEGQTDNHPICMPDYVTARDFVFYMVYCYDR